MLQFYSSSNSVVNSKRAMAECIENALEGQNNLDCDLLIFYTTMGHDFKDLLSEARRLSPKAESVGCTGMGVIGREGPNESMRALLRVLGKPLFISDLISVSVMPGTESSTPDWAVLNTKFHAGSNRPVMHTKNKDRLAIIPTPLARQIPVMREP